MSAKLVVTLLATSLLTVGCVAYTDDPYYRGGYGYHDHDDDRYDRKMDVAIVTGKENVGKSVREYTNNNVKMLANRIEIVVSGKKDTVNGRRKD